MIEVATHHRCGTVLMRNTFRQFCDTNSLVFFKGDRSSLEGHCDVYQSAHSRESDLFMDNKAHGIHLYRDPLKLLLSHIRYHQKTTSPTEAATRSSLKGFCIENISVRLIVKKEKQFLKLTIFSGEL